MTNLENSRQNQLEIAHGPLFDKNQAAEDELNPPPVSFTRFVLPFGYKREQINEPEKQQEARRNPHFEPREFAKEELAADRRKYFTMETGEVLFERTALFAINTSDSDLSSREQTGQPPNSWLDCDWAKGVNLVISKGEGNPNKIIKAALLPPRLLLFEWPQGGKTTTHSLFHSGFLLLDLYFPESAAGEKPELDDLIFINELFRYTDNPHEGAKKKLQAMMENAPSFLQPFSTYQQPPGTEENCFFRWAELLALPVKKGDKFFRLVPDNFLADSLQALRQGKIPTSLANYLIYADNRAYVWSAALLPNGKQSIESYLGLEKKAQSFDLGHWVKFLNIDPPSNHGPRATHEYISEFEKKWAKDRTYNRWEHFGTLYGFAYHGGVMLAGTPDEDDPPVDRHFATIYFDIVILLFYLRITLFRFSRQLTRITTKKRDRTIERAKWRNKFTELRGDFSEFTILYQFPLLSNQQQAVEMYGLARKWFTIEDFYKEIQGEIDSTHEYLSMSHSEKLAEASTKIAKLGIPLAIIAVIASLVGTDPLIPDKCMASLSCALNTGLFVHMALIVLSGLVINELVNLYFKDKNREENDND